MDHKAKTKKELLEELTILREELKTAQSAQTKRGKVDKALKKSDETYRILLENLADGYYEVDLKGNLTAFNDALCRILEYPREELLGMNNRQHTDAENARITYQAFNRVYLTGEPLKGIRYDLITKNGNKRTIETSISLIKGPSREPVGFRGIARDITELIQTQEASQKSEERYRTIIETMEEGYYEIDLEGNLTFTNEAMARFMGFSRVEFLGINFRQYVDAENANIVYQNFNQVFRTGEPSKGVQYEVITKTGGKRNVETSASLVRNKSGNPVGFRGIARDITDLVQAQKNLQKSEERYRTILETSEEGYYEVDLTGNLLFFNDALARVHGLSRHEMLRARERGYTDAENERIIQREYEQVFLTGKPAKGIRYAITTRTKEKRNLEVSIELMRDASGNPCGFRGITRDITGEIKTQNALKTSEERYRTIIESIEDAYYEVNLAGNFTFFNQAMTRIMEYPAEEMLGSNFQQYTDAENAKRLLEAFSQVFRTGEPIKSIRYNAFNKNGAVKSIVTSVSLIRDASGEPVGFRGISKDISDLIQIQNELRESEERYRTIIETIEDAYYEADLAGNLTFFNEAFTKTFDTSRDDLRGMNYRVYTDPDAAKKFFQDFSRVYRTGEAAKNLQYEITTIHGLKKSVLVSLSLIRDALGNPVGFRGIARDITDLMLIQTALKESEERYRTIIETIEDGYFEVDLRGNLTYFNDVMVGIHEYPRDELMGMNNRQYTDALNAEVLFQSFNQVYRTGEPSKGTQYEITTKSGGRKNLESSVSLIRNPKGDPVGFRGIARDVTVLIQAQKALQSSEVRFRIAAESTNDFIYEWDLPSGQIEWIGNAGEKLRSILGEFPVTAADFDSRIHPEDRARTTESVKNHLRKGGTYQEEYRMIGKDGNIIHLSGTGMGARDETGRVKKWIGAISDITKRKMAEQALLRSEERFRIAAESSNDFIYEWDLKTGRYEWFGSAVEKLGHILGTIPPDEKIYGEMIHPDDFDRVLKAALLHIQEGKPFQEEYRMVGKSGKVINVKDAARCLRSERGRAYKWIGALSDITERKKSEEELKQSFEKVRKAMGGIIQAMALTVESKDPYTAGHQQRVSSMARTIAQEMGLSKDRIEAIRLAGVVHDLGKISVPSEILSKPSKLSDLEFSLIKGHPQTSYEILKDIDFPWPIAKIALQHHERINGSGYPAGLKGDEIMIEAQVLMVADVVEAIASHRPYRPSLGIELAMEEISKNRGILYNPEAVDACLKLFREKGSNFFQPLFPGDGPSSPLPRN